MIVLAAAFFVTALLYASVGFGGGSTYTAILTLSAVDYRLIPPLSLACNIVVVAGGSVRFARAGITPWRSAALIVGLGAPAAFAGGLVEIGETAFVAVLGASLVFAGLALATPLRGEASSADDRAEPHPLARFVPFAAPPLGFLAGLVGIGGGVFLAPLLHLLRWRNARAVTATASVFILVNSLFGLAGQIAKGGAGRLALAVDMGLPLLLAVAVGGQIGSLLAQRHLPIRWIRWLTAALTLWVGARLLLTL